MKKILHKKVPNYFVYGVFAIALGVLAWLIYGVSTQAKDNAENVTYYIEKENTAIDKEEDITTEEMTDENEEEAVIEADKPQDTTPNTAQDSPAESPQTTTAPSTKNWWDYPDEILPVMGDPNDLNVVVNKKYQLPSDYVPSGLVVLSSLDCRLPKTLYVRNIITQALGELCTAAKADNIDLSIMSAYRSYSTQASTYQYWVNYNGGGAAGIAAADTVSARPGHSEHQLGTVVDFSTSAVSDRVGGVFNNTAAADWLEENAENYGFIMSYPEGMEVETGYSYEGWHFRFKGM